MNGNGGTRALNRTIPALLVAFSALALALVAGCGGGGGSQDKVVASAGDITVEHGKRGIGYWFHYSRETRP